MSTYLTVEDFIALFGTREVLAIAGIGGPNGAGGRQVDRPRVQAAIDRAASLADGHVLARFPQLAQMPAADIPPALKGAVADIARWYLRDETGDAGVKDDVVRKRYEDALAYLKGVQEGRIDLASDAPELAGTADGPVGRVHADMPPSRVAGAMRGWR